jgi:DNA-nicking Smr family endonuclease
LERGAAQNKVGAVPPPSPRLAKQQTAKPSLSSPARGELPVGVSPLAKDWERNLRSGRLTPDMTVDLHGHNLAGAHAALSRALDAAATQGVRVILLIAGKSRGPDEAPRGAIRRELETWLSHSHHARRILAVRNAHPRHGGAGAVYVVLRKGG